MFIYTTGLVLRVTDYKDSSRILTVLTSTEGKLTISARGARRRGSRLAAAAQPFAYSHMTLYRSRDRWTMTEAQPIELFPGLSGELALLALGAYFAELLEAVSDEDSPNPEVLSLGLNALFALSNNDKNPRLVKAAFEMRLMCLAGFEPLTSSCAVCGSAELHEPRLDITGGTVRCKSCRSDVSRRNGANETAALCGGSLEAMRYLASCDAKRIFSFKLPDDALQRLSRASEAFVAAQLDRSFKTLDYYKSIK
ncbi:MAG: DNA repair protein RecO [Clostridiales bacterium]|nr:DNA repair protein RecO [Clostridiales bacterium]